MSVVEFKTKAWMSKETAESFHTQTSEAPALYHILRYELYLRYVQRYAPKDAKILDLGCGTGLISVALHDLGYKVVGCDVSQGMLDQLMKTRGSRDFELRLGNGFSIPAQDGEFDMVVSRMFMQHFPNWSEILREQARVTREGGIILFDFGNREHIEAFGPDFGCDDRFGYCNDPSIPSKFYAVASMEEMTSVAASCGLDVVDILPHGLLLHNAHLWQALGSQGIAELNARLDELLQDDKARELFLLIEETFLKNMPKSTTYGNITILRRKSQK